MKLSGSVSGLETLQQRFSELKRAADNPTKAKAHEAGITLIWDMAARLVPVRTGNLKSAIMKVFSARSGELYVDAEKAPYWRFVEYGTRKMAPQSFIRAAWDLGKELALKAMIDVIGSAIRKAVRK